MNKRKLIRLILHTLLSVSLIGGLFTFSYADGTAVKQIKPPSGTVFTTIPETAFSDRINNERYYDELLAGGKVVGGEGAYDYSGSSKLKSIRATAAAASDKYKSISWSQLPAFDWRSDWNDSTKIEQPLPYSPVFTTRDQGAFGSCWSFAALASAEGSLVTKGLTDNSVGNYLSPYHLVFSTYNSYTFAANVQTSSSDANTYAKAALNGGGNHDMAGSSMSKWFGPALELQYRYPTTANPAPITDLSQLSQSKYHLQNVFNFPAPNDGKVGVSGGKGNASVVASQLNALKNAIYSYGPLMTSYYANGNYMQTGTYFSGKANGSTTYYQTANGVADHAVTMVGWNDNVPASAFNNGSGTQPKGNGAFLIQNSWGPNWGDGGGFFWISYYDPSIGTSAYFSLSNTADSAYLYYYDDVGYAGASYYNLSWYSGRSINYMSNVFTVGNTISANTIYSAAFYAATPGTQYKIMMYANPPAGNPSGGTALPIGANGSTSLTYTALFSGYNTAVFQSPQHMNAGDTFAIVIQVMNNNSDDSALTCEGVLYQYGSSKDNVTIAQGQSYFSSDGKTWSDLAKTYATAGSGLGNFNIRAYSSGVDIRSIGLSAAHPVRKLYTVGGAFDYYSGKIEVRYVDGTYNTLSLNNSNVTISGFDTSSPGTRIVTITYMGKTMSYNISVVNWVYVQSVSAIGGAPAKYVFDGNAKSHTLNISAPITPSNATDRTIIWSVAGPATVVSTGTSTARLSFSGAEGAVTVTAKSKDSPSYVRTAKINVANKATNVLIPTTKLYLTKTAPYQLPISIYNGMKQISTGMTFTSSNTNALTVSTTGKIFTKNIKKNATVNVTLATTSGYKKTFKVYVMTKSKKLTSFKIGGAPSKMRVGSSKQLSLKYSPAGATNVTPKYSSSKSGVVTIDAAGNLRAVGKGKAVITVKAGGKTVKTKAITVK